MLSCPYSLSHSSLDLEEGIPNGGTLSSINSRSLPQLQQRRSSVSRSESELSTTANELIQEYMKKVGDLEI